MTTLDVFDYAIIGIAFAAIGSWVYILEYKAATRHRQLLLKIDYITKILINMKYR